MERHRPTDADGKQALLDHLTEKALIARARHGSLNDLESVLRLLGDRSVVRYPVVLGFGDAALREGEFAYAEPVGSRPSEGYRLWVHPWFEPRESSLALLVAYHIPVINYGEVVEAADCEAFGSALLGMDTEAYYRAVCALADSVSAGV